MGSMDLEDGMETVQVEIVGPSGDVLVTCPVTMKEVIPAALRTSLHSIGKDAKGIYMFVLGTSILEEEMSFEKIGGVKGALVEVTVLDSWHHCFVWGFCSESNGCEIQNEGHLFQRGQTAATTDGVRARAFLPRETRCYVSFRSMSIGTHASLGVGTSSCKLAATCYSHLFGQDENSWALCFGRATDHRLVGYHNGVVCPTRDLGGEVLDFVLDQSLDILTIGILISGTGEMRVLLPGHHEEIVVPFGVPKDAQVFVVASTVYGDGRIWISERPDREQVSQCQNEVADRSDRSSLGDQDGEENEYADD